LGEFKEWLTIGILMAVLLGNVYALWKWKNSFMSKEDFKPDEYMKKDNFLDQCKQCKKEFQVADKEVKEDIKNMKTALVEEEKNLKTLAVIQIAMAQHVGMAKEKVDMFKDAIENGTDISSLL
jgi:hypothetical protein